MPPAPVIGQGGGVERPTKVLRQLDAEHLGHAAGDIDATGEVAVELDTVEEDTPARAATSFIVTAMIKPPGFSKNRMVSF